MAIDKTRVNKPVEQQKVELKRTTQKQKTGSVWVTKDGKNVNGEIVKAKIKGSNGQFIEQEYVKLKSLPAGRSLIMDTNGKQWVMSHDGLVLKQEYVNQNPDGAKKKSGYKASPDRINAINALTKNNNSARAEFNKQLEQDGWAGDVADGISKIWNNRVGQKIGISTGNTASQVREDFKTSESAINILKNAAKLSDASFDRYFKNIFGVEYNQKAVENYISNPTESNYTKAFGTKQKNMSTRVAKYNQSQQKGSAAVKTTAKVGGAIAVGAATVATGGLAGAAALGVTAAATTAISVAVEETDRMHLTGKHIDSEGEIVKDKGTFREGTNHGKILKDAAIDGAAVLAGGAVGKAAQVAAKGRKIVQLGLNVTGDVATGAAQEYVQTGEVTVQGTLLNAGFSTVGTGISTGLFKDGIIKVKKTFGNVNSGKLSAPRTSLPENMLDNDGNLIVGGFFGGKKNISLREKLFGQKPKTLDEHVKSSFSNAAVVPEGKGSKVISKMVQATKTEGLTTVKELNVSPSQIGRYTKEGEVCTIGNKLFVNEGGNAVELKMSKSKFEELFPPEGFARIEQHPNGNNCWLVSRLNSMTGSSYGRAQLYQMFEETTTCDILVHLKNGKSVRFPGGKPIDGSNTRLSLGDGASPGVEMVHQSVLAKVLSSASERGVDDVRKLSVSQLADEAGTLSHTDLQSSSYLLLGRRSPKIVSGKNAIVDALERLDSGRDMATAAWQVHERSIVGYNPKTQVVTYHDPYAGGIDLTCSIDEFTAANPTLFIIEAKPKAPITGQTVSSKAVQPKAISSEAPKTTKFTSRHTELSSRQLVVARTAEGEAIGATVTNSNVIIIKDGKRTVIPIPEEGTTTPVHETSTDTYLIIENKNGKVSITTSQTDELPSSSAQRTYRELNKPDITYTRNNTPSQQLAIPKGAKYVDTITLMGKQCRRIKMPNGDYLTEFNGKWKKI